VTPLIARLSGANDGTSTSRVVVPLVPVASARAATRCSHALQFARRQADIDPRGPAVPRASAIVDTEQGEIDLLFESPTPFRKRERSSEHFDHQPHNCLLTTSPERHRVHPGSAGPPEARGWRAAGSNRRARRRRPCRSRRFRSGEVYPAIPAPYRHRREDDRVGWSVARDSTGRSRWHDVPLPRDDANAWTRHANVNRAGFSGLCRFPRRVSEDVVVAALLDDPLECRSNVVAIDSGKTAG
jgi:hypothetical protein